MKIIISPAKKMVTDDGLAWKALPVFLEQTQALKERLQSLSYEEAKALWKCSDSIAKQNYARFSQMELRQNLTPAILSYEGIQYQYMAPGVLPQDCLDYIQEHLRILSGFYGVLRPFDGVTPYRLEMQAKLAIGGSEDLYGFWGDRLCRKILEEDRVILNLASQEYARCVSPFLKPGDRFVTCVFGERKNGKVIQKGTLAKMARGEMVRFLAETQARQPEDAKAFQRLGFRYHEELSRETEFVFLKEETGAEGL